MPCIELKKCVKTPEKPRWQVISSRALSRAAAKGMIERKAQDVIILDLRDIKNTMADFFVIGSAQSLTQLKSIAESVEQNVYRSLGESPWHTEGKNSQQWMLLDYTTVVAHIFHHEQRATYRLEDLWGHAKAIKPQHEGSAQQSKSAESSKNTIGHKG